MKSFFIALMLLIVCASFTKLLQQKGSLYPAIDTYFNKAKKDFDKIPADRKEQLQKIAAYIKTSIDKNKKVNLIFICTHNSRRSQMGQILGFAAAEYYGIKGVQCFSGGLEITAFNPRAVNALKNAGFIITKKTDSANSIYETKYGENLLPIVSFSKKYMDAPNPTSGFAAIMTCSHADASCPMVKGADTKIAIPYEDPKISDGKPEETAVYEERCKQIATELLYTFSLVKGNQ